MVVNPAQSRVGLTFNFKILPLQKGQVLAQKKYRQLSEDEDILLRSLHPHFTLCGWICTSSSSFFLVHAKSKGLQSHQPVAFKVHSPTAAY